MRKKCVWIVETTWQEGDDYKNLELFRMPKPTLKSALRIGIKLSEKYKREYFVYSSMKAAKVYRRTKRKSVKAYIIS